MASAEKGVLGWRQEDLRAQGDRMKIIFGMNTLHAQVLCWVYGEKERKAIITENDFYTHLL